MSSPEPLPSSVPGPWPQSADFARALLVHLQEAVLLMDADNVIRFASPSYEALLGYSAGELLGTRAGARVHPEDREVLQQKIATVWKDHSVAVHFHRLQTKEGELRYVRATGSYLADGAPWCPGPCLLATVLDETQEHQTLARLEASESFHRTMTESLREAVLVIAQSGQLLYASSSYLRLTGWSFEAMRTGGPFSRIHPEDRERVSGLLRQLMHGEEAAHRSNYRLLTQSGSILHVEAQAHYLAEGLPSLAGGPCVLAVIRDRSSEVAAELQLAENERFLQTLVDNLHDAVIVGRADGVLCFASTAYERLTGWTQADLLGSNARQRVHPDDLQAFRDALGRVLAGDPNVPAQAFRIFTKDERLLEVVLQLRLLPAGMPGVPGPLIMGAIRDRSSEAQAERALADRERFFRALIDNLQDGIIVLSLDQKTRFVSPAYARMVGRDPVAAAAMGPGDRIYEEDLPRAKASFVETVADPLMAKVTEYRLKRPDGSLLWVRAVSRYLPDGIPGSPQPCVLIVARDVQVERQSEQELRRFERLALLGEMTAGLAHELRNPLMAISATAELLRGSQLLGEEERQDTDTILVQARRLRELLDQTLSKHKVQEPQAIPAENALRVASALARRSFGPSAEKVTQSFEIETGAPNAWGEPGPLQQVLLNLILNALQAMPQGGALSLRAKREEGGVRFSVIDSGPGVPDEALPHIFDPFFTTKSYGSGLGLSVSHRIVQSHAGKLWAERLPQGMAFHAWIPAPPKP